MFEINKKRFLNLEKVFNLEKFLYVVKGPSTSSKVRVVVNCSKIGGAVYRIATACLGKPIRKRHYDRMYFIKLWTPGLIKGRWEVLIKRGHEQFEFTLAQSNEFIVPSGYSEVFAKEQWRAEVNPLADNVVVFTREGACEVLSRLTLHHHTVYILDKPMAQIIKRSCKKEANVKVKMAPTPFVNRGAFVAARIIVAEGEDFSLQYALAHLTSSFSEVWSAE